MAENSAMTIFLMTQLLHIPLPWSNLVTDQRHVYGSLSVTVFLPLPGYSPWPGLCVNMWTYWLITELYFLEGFFFLNTNNYSRQIFAPRFEIWLFFNLSESHLAFALGRNVKMRKQGWKLLTDTGCYMQTYTVFVIQFSFRPLFCTGRCITLPVIKRSNAVSWCANSSSQRREAPFNLTFPLNSQSESITLSVRRHEAVCVRYQNTQEASQGVRRHFSTSENSSSEETWRQRAVHLSPQLMLLYLKSHQSRRWNWKRSWPPITRRTGCNSRGVYVWRVHVKQWNSKLQNDGLAATPCRVSDLWGFLQRQKSSSPFAIISI